MNIQKVYKKGLFSCVINGKYFYCFLMTHFLIGAQNKALWSTFNRMWWKKIIAYKAKLNQEFSKYTSQSWLWPHPSIRCHLRHQLSANHWAPSLNRADETQSSQTWRLSEPCTEIGNTTAFNCHCYPVLACLNMLVLAGATACTAF